MTFSDGTLSLTSGQALRCLSTSYDFVASWVVETITSPLDDFFLNCTNDIAANPTTTPNYSVRGSSTFFSENKYGGNWQVVNGQRIKLDFTGSLVELFRA